LGVNKNQRLDFFFWQSSDLIAFVEAFPSKSHQAHLLPEALVKGQAHRDRTEVSAKAAEISAEPNAKLDSKAKGGRSKAVLPQDADEVTAG